MITLARPTLLFVRHGETTANPGHKRLPGWGAEFNGGEFDQRAKKQVEKAADRVATYPLHHIYSSPLKRSHDTAEIVGQRTGTAITHTAAAGPWDYGKFTGQPDTAKVLQQLKFFQDRPAIPTEGGEPYKDFLNRWDNALEKFKQFVGDNPDKALVIVTHSRNLYALRHLLNGRQGPISMGHGEFTPAMIVRVQFDQNGKPDISKL